MDIEIENMRDLSVFTAVPRPLNTNIITPRWVFHWNFEDGSLVRHKARLVSRGFAHVFGVDNNESYLYAPVMRLESFRVLAPIAALFDLDIRPSEVSAAYLHGDIDGEVYMGSPPVYGDRGSVLEGNETRPRGETHVYVMISNYIQVIRVYTLSAAARGWRGCSSLRRGGGRSMTSAREGSNLYLQLGGPITDLPNGGRNFGRYPISTQYLEYIQPSCCVSPQAMYEPYSVLHKQGGKRSNNPGLTNLSGAA